MLRFDKLTALSPVDGPLHGPTLVSSYLFCAPLNDGKAGLSIGHFIVTQPEVMANFVDNGITHLLDHFLRGPAES